MILYSSCHTVACRKETNEQRGKEEKEEEEEEPSSSSMQNHQGLLSLANDDASIPWQV